MLDEVLLLGDLAETEVILVRHAQQELDWFKDPSRPRAGDAPLSPTGQRQAAAAGRALAGERIDAVFTSHLQRARATADEIARHHGLEPVVDERLREAGIYEAVPDGRTVLDELGERGLDELHHRFETTRTWDTFPFSESSASVATRTAAALADAVADAVASAGTSRIVVVCHTGTINTIVARATASTIDALFYPAHASFSRLAWGRGRFVVRTLNEHHHVLADGPATY